MREKGIEASVASIFKSQLNSACLRNGIDDLAFDLNGADRLVNADNMFSICDRFFLIEMKSWDYNISSEALKPSVCDLCTGLTLEPTVRNWHRQCHYLMWAEMGGFPPGIQTYCSIYEDCVCRPNILPNCPGLTYPQHQAISLGTALIASILKEEKGGLTAPEFFYYLEWLLGTRTGPAPTNFRNTDVPIALVGNSGNRGIFGKVFTTFNDLDAWGKEALDRKINRKSPFRP
ncbi:hypothetical protein R9X49_21890 [Pectobacterium carotovorum]|uniref:hypothetical protein n=1 Tax=Pectobacterium carotovorum TaxID=554 RepID=UPI0029DA3BBC|nr:hypothetical protein [Pectobacterium carotovorum]MDX6917750.1 hypothetical protein [Pectobacterium carotovorum]